MTIELDRRKMLQLLGLGAGSMPLIGHAPLAFAAGDTVTIGWPTDVPSWDPNQRFSPDVQPIFKLVFDQPVNQDPKLAFVPNLATKWELAPDALSMAVDLRDDVTFQNGDKLTADDLRYTFFERIKAGHKVDTANSWRKVIDIEVQSPTRAVMKFKEPAPTAPVWLAFLGSFVVPKKYMEATGVEGFIQKPVGTGPYKLVEYQLNSRIVLERNDAYWGPKPKIRRVIFEIIKDPSARVAAIQSGQVDLTINVPVREVDRLGHEAGLAAELNPITRVILLQCRNDLGFADDNVRLAAHHAIDKQAISKAFFNGAATPISVLAVPGSPGYVDGFSFPYSLDKAKEYLAKSGFGPDKPAKMHFFTTNGAFPNDFEMARAIAGMWKKVGIEADIEVIELAKYYELNHAGKMPEATLYRWGNDTGDPEIYTGYILNPKLRFSAWKSDDIAEPIAKLFGETDYEKRIKGYRDLNVMVVEKGYAMPLLQGVSTVAYRDTVGFTAYGNGWILPATMTKK
jgi:peptide/nickel transport system substrate-binding protein